MNPACFSFNAIFRLDATLDCIRGSGVKSIEDSRSKSIESVLEIGRSIDTAGIINNLTIPVGD